MEVLKCQVNYRITNIISDIYKELCLLFKLDIVLKQLVKMAPKNNKPSKIDNQSKTMNYPIKKGEYIKEIYQANKLENLIRKYNSLNNPSITFREFNHAIACRVLLYPLEILHKKEIDITKSYLLRWKEISYLSNFNEWADNPHDVPFIGPDQNLYKIIP